MKRGITIIGCLLLVLTLFMLSVGCAPKPKPEAVGELKIGVTLNGGPAATLFESFHKSLDMQAEMINTEGMKAAEWVHPSVPSKPGPGVTVGGKRYLVKLIREDNYLTVEGVVKAYQKLRSEHDIRFLIGPGMHAEAIVEARERDKVLHFSMSPTYTIETAHGFKPHTSGDIASPASLKYIAEQYPNAKIFVGLGPNNPMSKGNEAATRRLFDTELKGRFDLKDIVFYETGVTDFTPILTRLLQYKPDIIQLVMAANEEEILQTKQARDLGYKGLIVYTYPVSKGELTKAMKPEYIYNLVLSGIIDWNNPPTPRTVEYRDKFKARWGEMPNEGNFYVLDHLFPMVKAIEEADTFDTDRVVQVLESWETWENHMGSVTWGGKETTGGWKHVSQGRMPMLIVKSVDDWVAVVAPPVTVP